MQKSYMIDEHELNGYPYFTPFHTTFFSRLIEKHLSFSFHPAAVRENDKRFYIPLFKAGNGDAFQIGAVGYGGIFPFPESMEEFSAIIENIENTYGRVHKITLPPLLEKQVYEWDYERLEFQSEHLNTYIMEIDDYRLNKDMFFSGKIRTCIRYAQKNEVRIRVTENDQQFDMFYDIYRKTMDRVQASYYADQSLLKALIANGDTAKLYLAYHEEEIIAGSLFLFSEYQTFYWINASLYEKRSLCANYLLIFRALEDSAAGNKKYLNFGYSHNANIARAKIRWGCAPAPYLTLKRN